MGSPSGGHGLIPHVQFSWSRLRTTQGKRCAERAPVAEPGEHLDRVALDPLARAAAVTLLPAAQVGVDRVAVEDEARRQAADDGDERRPVRLACGGEREVHAGKPKARRITSTGAGTPVHSRKAAAPCARSTSRPPSTVAPASRAAAAVAVSG